MKDPILHKIAASVVHRLKEYLIKERALKEISTGEIFAECPSCGQMAKIGDYRWICKECDSQGDVITYAKIRYHLSSDEKALQEVCRTLNVQFPVLLTISARDLLTANLPEKEVLIKGILTPGLYILAGAPKIGKSLVALQIAINVSTGQQMWGRQTKKSDVLYLSLEDSEHVIQNRFNAMLTALGDVGEIYIATEAPPLGCGLEEYLSSFLQQHPKVKLVIIDTLGRAKGKGDDKYNYFADYAMMMSFKKITNRFCIAILLIHHTRKQESNDVMSMISGTNGLFGAVDGALLMIKPDRQKKVANIYISAKSFPDCKETIIHDDQTLLWNLSEETTDEGDNDIITAILDFMLERESWEGTATELLGNLKEINPQLRAAPNSLIRRINNAAERLEKHSLRFSNGRNGNDKIKLLERTADS